MIWYKNLTITLAFAVSGMLVTGPLSGQQPSFNKILKQYQSFDMDSDGDSEINSLKQMKLDGDEFAPISDDKKRVLVLVEERLLNRIPGSPRSVRQLMDRFKQFRKDLIDEGYAPLFITCDVYAGTRHQDGLTLLALRRFIKNVDTHWSLDGVILVGSFPEAMLVRRWVWKRKKWNVTIAGTAYKGARQRDFLRIVPEAVAPRADIVLADLDGNWEEIYQKEPRKLESIEALPLQENSNWPVDDVVFESSKFNDKTIEFEDFFWIQEDQYERLDAEKGVLKLKLKTAQRHPEISAADRLRRNPIAVPEIQVSRINPRHVAVRPRHDFRDRHGRHFLDSNGKPQVIETETPIKPTSYLQRDPAFERKLLLEYFDRNHDFRTGAGNGANGLQTAAASYGRGLISATRLNSYLAKSSPRFTNSVSFDSATLLDYVQFLKTPARMKGMSAHSNPWNTSYGRDYDVNELHVSLAGPPWRWKETRVGSFYRYTPSLEQQGGAADSYIHRTVYENQLLANVGSSLFIHNGCEVNTPEGATRYPYSHPRYGSATGFQNAESILFFLNGVALAARSKVFYDTPRGFTEIMGKDAGHCFGAGWRAYFETEANDPSLVKNVAGNKRTYPWSVIGDWTLTPTPRKK